jgi:hypothetical protein
VACGLSLGEYTALAFAGAFSFEDGLRLVKLRGEAMQAAANTNPSAMMSIIGLDSAKVTELCEVRRSIACGAASSKGCGGAVASSMGITLFWLITRTQTKHKNARQQERQTFDHTQTLNASLTNWQSDWSFPRLTEAVFSMSS